MPLFGLHYLVDISMSDCYAVERGIACRFALVNQGRCSCYTLHLKQVTFPPCVFGTGLSPFFGWTLLAETIRHMGVIARSLVPQRCR
jgi:hypothetical protein